MFPRKTESAADLFGAGAGARFTTTDWSVVLDAGRTESVEAQEALSKLCHTYWYPLYAYARRRGYKPEDAQDLTQDFFARLLERRVFAQIHPDKGRFRSFLLAAMNHFLANEWDRARAQKRGGGCQCLSLEELRDKSVAEGRYLLEPVDGLDAERLFARRWALTLLERALAAVKEAYHSTGKKELFQELKPCLTGDRTALSYHELAKRLGMTEGALKVAVYRIRERYRQALRSEIAHTLSDPKEIEDELHYLFQVLAG